MQGECSVLQSVSKKSGTPEPGDETEEIWKP